MIHNPLPVSGYQNVADSDVYARGGLQGWELLRLYRRSLPSIRSIVDGLQPAAVRAMGRPPRGEESGYAGSLDEALRYFDPTVLEVLGKGGAGARQRVLACSDAMLERNPEHDRPLLITMYGTLSNQVFSEITRSVSSASQPSSLLRALWHPPLMLQNQGIQWLARWPQARWTSPPLDWNELEGEYIRRTPDSAQIEPLTKKHSRKVRTVLAPLYEHLNKPEHLARLHDHSVLMNKDELLIVAAAILHKDRPDVNVVPVINLI